MSASPERPAKRQRRTPSTGLTLNPGSDSRSPDGEHAWADWPAPVSQMNAARSFITEIVERGQSVLLLPDKDADGLSAGTMMYNTLKHLGVDSARIKVHHLAKGSSLHTETERQAIDRAGTDAVIVLDQGSRPGPPLASTARCLIIDHHTSDEFPDDAVVATACRSPPIATASLLTYLILRPLHPNVLKDESWRAVVGTVGDLGPKGASWGTPPWPGELAHVLKSVGSKNVSDCVAAINAPRRTAEYNVPRAWEILLGASQPRQVGNNAFLQLCKLDVKDETEKWARTAPKFSMDGKVALITIDSGFQIHPVIATRWAGNLGRKSKKLVMVMCANIGFNPDPDRVSFSCRLASEFRNLPESQRPNLIQMLQQYAEGLPGFSESVGADFARGHKEATGGIIDKDQFARLVEAIGIGERSRKKASSIKPISDYFAPLKPGERK